MPSVDPEQLRTHAQNIDSIADAFADVIGAGDQIIEDDEAYGLLCQWIPPILAERQQDQQEITKLLQTNLGKIAGALRESATAYENTDEEAAASFERQESELGDGSR
ncbi:type VII secretion target [Glycomyces sp. NPDC046736]|uniref:type VII secretion target n=1 Tax=Glycomyces sp. NPDC046736 TaxID=3155615 RepID=UPI0033CC3CB5